MYQLNVYFIHWLVIFLQIMSFFIEKNALSPHQMAQNKWNVDAFEAIEYIFIYKI